MKKAASKSPGGFISQSRMTGQGRLSEPTTRSKCCVRFPWAKVLAWLYATRKRESDGNCGGCGKKRGDPCEPPRLELIRYYQNFAFAVTRKVRPRPVSIVLPAIVLDDGV